MESAPLTEIERRVRRDAPFLVAMTVPYALVLLGAGETHVELVLLAAALNVLHAAAGILLPWDRLPAWTHPILPMAYSGVVALLRHAEGGARSGFAFLYLIPVVWVALHGRRRDLVLNVATAAVLLAAPIVLIGDPLYPDTEVRRVAVWVTIASIVGATVQSLVGRVRDGAALEHLRAEEAEQARRHLETVLGIARGLGGRGNVRRQICRAALETTGASMAMILEPAGDRHLVSTAWESDGVPVPAVTVEIGGEPSGVVVAYLSQARFFVSDVPGHPAVSNRIAQVVGAHSVVFEPIVSRGTCTGVLVVAWPFRVATVDDSAAIVISLLATEAGVAIERADLTARLERLARTDPLTGLSNRRQWDALLQRELARAGRTHAPVAVASLDLDHFKHFNDTFGHQEGDRFLVEAAATWSECLRDDVDVLARWGGEEFALLLPDCGLEQAREVADRLRLVTPRGRSCSVGVALWDGIEDVETLIKRADQALYDAKAAGRDRVVVA